MKYHPGLLRGLMEAIQETESIWDFPEAFEPLGEEYAPEEILYHLELLRDEELAAVSFETSSEAASKGGRMRAMPVSLEHLLGARLTLKGHVVLHDMQRGKGTEKVLASLFS